MIWRQWGDTIIPERKRRLAWMHKELTPSDLGLTFSTVLSLPLCSFSTWSQRWGWLHSGSLATLCYHQTRRIHAKHKYKMWQEKCLHQSVVSDQSQNCWFLNENFWLHRRGLQLPLAPIKFDLWGAKQCPGGLQSLLLWNQEPFILSPANM